MTRRRPSLADVGESGLLERLRRWIDPAPRGSLGIGDDAAIIPPDGALLTTDALVEGTHFHRHWLLPEEVGAKAIAVNVSDAAAMGGRARAALISLILPPRLPVDAVRRLYAGIGHASRREGIAVLGGNLARGSECSITVALLGAARRPIRRDGARPGDVLYVTGEPGLARLGLTLVERFARGGPDLWKGCRRLPSWRRRLAATAPGALRAARRFWSPTARSEVGLELRRFAPTALIDVSDGMAADVLRLARASRASIRVDAARLPLSASFRRLARAVDLDPLRAAWQGGEDYELLFTVPRRVAERLGPRATLAGVRLTRIGEVVRGRPEVALMGEEIPNARGFEHFTRRPS